jgi:hypothetical protein
MRSEIEAYVYDVVAVREPAPNLAAIRARARGVGGATHTRRPSETVMPALIAIGMLACFLVGQVAAPLSTATSIRTPAPAPAQTA